MNLQRAVSVLQRPHVRRLASLLILLVAALASMATSMRDDWTRIEVGTNEQVTLESSAVVVREHVVTLREPVVPEAVDLQISVRGADRDFPVELRVRSTAERDLITADRWQRSPVRYRFDAVSCHEHCQVGLRVELRRSTIDGVSQGAPTTVGLRIAIHGGVRLTEEEARGLVTIRPAEQPLEIATLPIAWIMGLALVAGSLLGWVLVGLLSLGRATSLRIGIRRALLVSSAGLVAASLFLPLLAPSEWGAPVGASVVLAIAVLTGIVGLVNRSDAIGMLAIGVLSVVLIFGAVGIGVIREAAIASSWNIMAVVGALGLLGGIAVLGLLRVEPRPPGVRPARPIAVLVVAGTVAIHGVAAFVAVFTLRSDQAVLGAMMFGVPAGTLLSTGWLWWRRGQSAPHRIMAILMAPFLLGLHWLLMIQTGFSIFAGRDLSLLPENLVEICLLGVILSIFAAYNREPLPGPSPWRRLRGDAPAPLGPNWWGRPPS